MIGKQLVLFQTTSTSFALYVTALCSFSDKTTLCVAYFVHSDPVDGNAPDLHFLFFFFFKGASYKTFTCHTSYQSL